MSGTDIGGVGAPRMQYQASQAQVPSSRSSCTIFSTETGHRPPRCSALTWAVLLPGSDDGDSASEVEDAGRLLLWLHCEIKREQPPAPYHLHAECDFLHLISQPGRPACDVSRAGSALTPSLDSAVKWVVGPDDEHTHTHTHTYPQREMGMVPGDGGGWLVEELGLMVQVGHGHSRRRKS
eukprot:2050181-Rhodomonas_salina.1